MAEHFASPLRSLDDDRLGLALADLGAGLDWPPTPSLAASVGAALRAAPTRRPWFRPLGRGLALGLLAAVLVAGLAAAIGFALGGLRITFGEGSPGPLPSQVVASRAFGEEVTLDAARARVGRPILAPGLAGIGEPDHVYVAEPPVGGAVSLVWGNLPGLPAGADGIGLVITQFRADIGPETFEKLLNSGVRIENAIVNGTTGYWIEGGEHFFFYRDANGIRQEGTIRLVGTALIWEQDGLTLRIEGAPTLDEALRIAGSLE